MNAVLRKLAMTRRTKREQAQTYTRKETKLAPIADVIRDLNMAETSEKVGQIAARVLSDNGVCSADDAKRLAGSVLRQKEKKARKKALRSAGVS